MARQRRGGCFCLLTFPIPSDGSGDRRRAEAGRKKAERKKERKKRVIESGQLIVRVLARFFVNPLLTESIHPQPAATAQAVRLLSLVKS